MDRIRRPASEVRARLTPRSVAVACLLAGLLWLTRASNGVDRIWSDLLTASQRLPASSGFVVVNLTAKDIVAFKDASTLRTSLAQDVTALKAAGVKRIMFDMFLSGQTVTKGDLVLASAFSDFGRDRIAFGQTSDVAFAAPPLLYGVARNVEVGMLADSDGYFRELRLPGAGTLGNPAIWLATGRSDRSTTPIDLRLNPESVETYGLDDVKRPEVLAQLRGKTVIFALDRSASRTRASLPVYGIVDRGRFLAIAAESYSHGTAQRLQIAGWIGFGLAVLSLIFGLIAGATIRSVRASLAILPALCIFVIAGCLLMNFRLGASTNPMTTIFIGAMGMMVAIGFRLRLPELLAGLFAGDLSPEEAWLWRSQADQDRPVLIFGADGSVRRSNSAAIMELDLTEEKHSERALHLARQCMPGIGVRADILTTGDRVKSRWRVEWPHASIPLAVFFDITDQVSKEEDLQRKLITDPLTGLQNRLGFDTALQAISLENGEQFALFYLDMNGFKQVNDTLGHDAGDELLSIVARRFESVVRDGDVLARLGGDEFGLCLHGPISQAGAQRMADKLQGTLATPIRLKKGEVQVGVAVGFSIRAANDSSTDEVIRRADEDMYRKKKARQEKGSARSLANLSA